MYASCMRKRFGVPLVVMVAWSLASCHTAGRKTAMPTPEAEQAIGETLKDLYMAAGAATPQSPEQQKVILRMAEKASNGKELLLVMRAAVGVFPAGASSQGPGAESRLHSTVTAKMIALATLDQLIEYAAQYAVETESARPLVQRMFQLANDNSDPRVWQRIRVAAFHLKATDLERQAQARAGQLAGR